MVCYMTKLGRWVGVLEVLSECYIDETPLFYPENDPYVCRFKVRPLIWLEKEKAVPIHEGNLWDNLSFTRGCDPASSTWTGKIRRSLNKLSADDAGLIERALAPQEGGGTTYPVDPEKYARWLTEVVRRPDRAVPVTVPEDAEEESRPEHGDRAHSVRESTKMQALLAAVGEKMGFRIWLPRADRSAVCQEWNPQEGSLVSELPLSYDAATLRTIEQIDVLWLKGRSIARAFEVEHTTAVYSGILRMADLLALQPNMDISLHIVAPEDRKAKVMNEIQRPVFTLLEKGPLSDYCTFLPYEGLRELSNLRHLGYLSDTVLEEYAEGPE